MNKLELTNFDIAEYLDNKKVIAEYLSQIAKAKGMSQIAKDTGLS